MGRWSYEPWRILNRISSKSNNLTNRKRNNSVNAKQVGIKHMTSRRRRAGKCVPSQLVWRVFLIYLSHYERPTKRKLKKKLRFQLIQGINLPSIQLFLRYSASEVRLTTHSRFMKCSDKGLRFETWAFWPCYGHRGNLTPIISFCFLLQYIPV